MFAESHRVWCRYAFHVLLISLCLGPRILFVQAQDIRPDEEIAFGKPTYHNGPYAIWSKSANYPQLAPITPCIASGSCYYAAPLQLELSFLHCVISNASPIGRQTYDANHTPCGLDCNSTEGPKMVNLLHKIGRLLEGVVIPNASVASRNPVPAYGFHAMMGKSTTGEYVADRFSKACRGETESHGFQRDVVPRFVCLHEPGLAEPPELMDDEEHYSRNPFQGNPGLRYLDQRYFPLFLAPSDHQI